MTTIDFETSPGQQYHLTFLPGTIALHGQGHFQFFKNPTNLEDLALLFPHPGAIVDRAELHRQGRVNKDRFIAAVVEDLTLQAPQKVQLSRFIADCDCAPDTVRTKLRAMGFAAYIDKLVREEPDPQMATSVCLIQHLRRKREYSS